MGLKILLIKFRQGEWGVFFWRRVEMSDQAIFEDTSSTIQKALQKTFAKSASKTRISETAFEIALKELV